MARSQTFINGESTMSKPKKNEEQLEEIEVDIANYQRQLSRLQLEILKLELKQEKLRDKRIIQWVKEQIGTRA